ncbi:hypothetical protein LTR70_009846 [Exophiala xenobiotica]|uniref:Uncharacterized protein n=1 Tax=Lithohypha guttulata TaxID=1690604 RepID=A0ABR0JWM4_9EURO|nr:hypothetical protein LTR24_009695 [Lithohypha guttulata]KAK5309969.1 hypothetical protein LTR70_009846 [Exophiala xenobiotica]
MAPFSFNPRAAGFFPSGLLTGILNIGAPPPAPPSASSTHSSLNPVAAVFTPSPTPSTNSTTGGATSATSSPVVEVGESSFVSDEGSPSSRMSRSVTRERSSSVRRSYSGDRAPSPVRSASVPRSFAPPSLASTRTQEQVLGADEDGYKPPLVVDGAGPASRFEMVFNPTAPVFVPLPAESRPLEQTRPLNPLALEYTPNDMLIARAQLSIILGLPVSDEYNMRFQTWAVPMPCAFVPVETHTHQHTGYAAAPALNDWNLEATGVVPVIEEQSSTPTSRLAPQSAKFMPQNYFDNRCTDFLWTPSTSSKPKPKRVFSPYGEFNPLTKGFAPNTWKDLIKRKNLKPNAKSFVPGQLWMDAVVETFTYPILTVRWEIINEIFARIVKQVEALRITITTTSSCRSLIRQSNKAVLVVRPSTISKPTQVAKEFVSGPKDTVTAVVRRLDAGAPTFVPWTPFLLQALWWYRTLILAAAYFMSLPNTCTEIIRRPNPLAKTFTPIKDLIVFYQGSITDLMLCGALVAVKIVSFESAVSLGPTPATMPTLRPRLFVSSLCFPLPSISNLGWNGNNSTLQLAVLSEMPDLDAASDLLPVFRAPLRDMPVALAVLFTQLDVDDFVGVLRSVVVSTLAIPPQAQSELEELEELETMTGPLVVDSTTYVDAAPDIAEDDSEEEVFDPEAPLELPPRPSSPNPDNWDRETIFATDDDPTTMALPSADYDKSFVSGFPTLTIADIVKDTKRDIHPFTHLLKPFSQLCEEGFGPSEKQLDSDFDGWRKRERIAQQPVGHHLSFFGNSVPCKSDTSPAKSMAIIFSTPKPELAPNATDTNFGRHIALKNAFLFVDPIVYVGDRSVPEFLFGSALENHAIYETFKFYSSPGTWQHEVREPDDDHIGLDTLDPTHYPEEYAVLNGIDSSCLQPTRESVLGGACSAHAKSVEARKTAAEEWRKQRDALRTFIKLDPHTCFPQSNLRLSYTPESMLAEELAEQEAEEYDPNEIFAGAVAQDSLLRPDSRSWADIDEDDWDDGHSNIHAVGSSTVDAFEEATSESDPEAPLLIAGGEERSPAPAVSADNSTTAIGPSDHFIPGLVEDYADSVAEAESTPESTATEDETQAVMGVSESPIYEQSEDETLESKAIDADDAYISDDDLFGMSFREEYKAIHGRSPPESPSKDPSPKTSSEEPSSEEDSPNSEELSPVPSLEVRRLTSDALRAVSGDFATPSKKGREPEFECIVETPDSVKKIMNTGSAHRMLSDPDSSSAIPEGRMFGVFKDLSSPPKRRISRSPALRDLSAAFHEGPDRKHKAQKAAATLSEIREDDEDAPESPDTPTMKRSLSLSDINQEFRDFHGIPGLGQKPLSEEINTNNYELKTPISKKNWNARRASIAQLTPICDEESTPVTQRPVTPAHQDYSDTMMTPDPPSSPSIPSDTPEIDSDDSETEIGGAVVQQTYRVSTHDLPRTSQRASPVRRPLRQSPLSTRIGIFNGPLAPHQHFFSDFDGAWEHTAHRFSGSSYSRLGHDAVTLVSPSPDDVVTQPSISHSQNAATRPSLTKRLTTHLFGPRKETITTDATDTNETKPKGFLRKVFNTLTRRR